jgi:hypothetical protein
VDTRNIINGPDRLELLMSFAFHKQLSVTLENKSQLFIMVNRMTKVNENVAIWDLEGWTPRDGKPLPVRLLYSVFERTGSIVLGAK